MNKEEIINITKRAIVGSYAKYSRFKVSACVYAGGNYYTGANVENSSYSLTLCAERSAGVKAVNDGAIDFEAVCIYHNGKDLPYPCGACLQFLTEFCSAKTIFYIVNDSDCITKYFNELLPFVFKLEE